VRAESKVGPYTSVLLASLSLQITSTTCFSYGGSPIAVSSLFLGLKNDIAGVGRREDDQAQGQVFSSVHRYNLLNTVTEISPHFGSNFSSSDQHGTLVIVFRENSVEVER